MARLCDVNGCDKPHRARGLCSGHWKATHGKRTKYPRTCEVCASDYLSDGPSGQFCSDACKGSAYRRSRALVGPIEPNVCRLPIRHPARRSQPRARTWYAGRCAWCDEAFVDNQPRARFCSPQHEANAGRARRGRFIVPMRTRLALYERDGWTCQLCMEQVDPDLMITDPLNDWAPSLDHIECQSWTDEPDHSPGNLRLAHRWCNSVRGDGSHYTEYDLRISPAA